MIQPDLTRTRWSRRSRWGVAAVLLLLLAATAFLVVGTRAAEAPAGQETALDTEWETAQPSPSPPVEGTGGAGPADPGTPAAAGVPGAPADAGGPGAPAGPAAPGEPGEPGAVPAADRSVPVELRIPAIGVATSLTDLGLNPDNTVEVPSDFQQAGWFGLGPTPGEEGSSVVLGHVDSYRGPAVFFRLRSLKAGDDVEVTRADGSVARFAVTSVATYPKDRFPAEQVYAPHGGSDLHLVTCGGEFDRQARSYRSNIVAYTSLVSVTPPPAG